MLWNAALQVKSAFSPSCLRNHICQDQTAWATLTNSIKCIQYTHSNCHTHAYDPLLVHAKIKHAHLCTLSRGSQWVSVFVNWTLYVHIFFLMEQRRGCHFSWYSCQFQPQSARFRGIIPYDAWTEPSHTLYITMERVRGNLHDYRGIETDWWRKDLKAKHGLVCRSHTFYPP